MLLLYMEDIIMQIRVDAKDSKNTIVGIIKKLNNLDEYYESVARPRLIKHLKDIFGTSGLGEWADNKMPHKTLDKTGRLKRSYTKVGAPGNVSKITKKSFEHGSNVHYAKVHEEGLGRVQKREVIGLVVKRQLLSRSYVKSLNKWVIGE